MLHKESGPSCQGSCCARGLVALQSEAHLQLPAQLAQREVLHQHRRAGLVAGDSQTQASRCDVASLVGSCLPSDLADYCDFACCPV